MQCDAVHKAITIYYSSAEVFTEIKVKQNFTSTAALTIIFYYFSFVSASAHVKAVLCGMTQYGLRPKRSAIRVQAVYFLHSMMPSVTCLRLSDISVICRVTYFIFQFSLLFFYISVVSQHQHCGVLLVLIRNIGHRTLPKI